MVKLNLFLISLFLYKAKVRLRTYVFKLNYDNYISGLRGIWKKYFWVPTYLSRYLIFKQHEFILLYFFEYFDGKNVIRNTIYLCSGPVSHAHIKGLFRDSVAVICRARAGKVASHIFFNFYKISYRTIS